WVINDREVCWRFRVSGEVDLRDRIEINGVYGNWIGRFQVKLPNGENALIFESPNYNIDVSQFGYLSGSRTLDACVLDLDAWWGKSLLEGTYTASIVLYGPYENRSILFSRNYTYTANLNISVAPTVWNSWNQSIVIQIVNTGDVPLILQGIGIEHSGTGTGIGFTQISEEVIMPGESKSVAATVQTFDYVRENFKGKSASLDFNLNFAGINRVFKVVTDVTFPKN
ncbi:MAG: hypothetical protein QXO72_03490, partial [Sulfolobales archaeon]